MSGASLKKNDDKLNTIGIVTVGLTGAALVYLSIIGIEAWYQNETSAVDQVAKFGKQDEVRKNLKAAQIGHINDPEAGPLYGPQNTQLYVIPIATAKDLVVRDAKIDAANLVPAIGRSETPTVAPVYGRPMPLKPATPPPAIDPTAPVDPTAPAVPGATPPAGATPTGVGTPATPAGGAEPPVAPTPAGTVPPAAAATPPAATPPAAGTTPPAATPPAAGGH